MTLTHVNSRSFPTGQTSSALLKALRQTLSADKGAGAADLWLRRVRMVRDDLEDETRLVPLPTLHHALVEFVKLAPREAVARTTPWLVVPETLGVWVRVLRGTTSPAEAFARLDSTDSEYGRTTRWETTHVGRGHWRGRVSILHDPALEEDGLLRLGRLAELSALPVLFGYGQVQARAIEPESRVAGVVQEYEVDWADPSTAATSLGAGAIGLAVGAAPLLLHLASVDFGVLAVAVGGAVGGLAGVVRARDRLRRAETHAQRVRVLALERGLSLKETREREAGGQLEGSVAAGQYRILRRMGSGATGVIYEAVRLFDGHPVAIKLLRVAAAHEAVASDRLRREAEALGLSWHPNVVEVLDHGHLADGTAYLVMELLMGESLAARLSARGRIPPRELLPMALQVCDALAAVHAAGVVHRDLKPSNIFLVPERDAPSGPERVKLLDFGIARVEWEETRITNTGGPLGTPGYMSPEQESGTSDIDGRTDLFSLGALLFECLVGDPPPPQTPSGLVRTGQESAVRIDSGTQKASSLIPVGWRAVIEKAMAIQPEARFADARSFAQALRKLTDGVVEAEASS